MSLTSNQKLEMIKLSEEGMSKAKIGQKLGLLCHLTNFRKKGKVLERNQKGYSREHTNDKKGKQSYVADTQKVWVLSIDDHTSHNIPLSQSLIPNKALTL